VIAERVSRLLGGRVVSLHQIESRGYAAAYHGVAVLEDGLTVFVKAGTEEVTSGFLRKEIRFYRSFQAPFMPVFHGADDAYPPVLVIEDLRRERWPPPWDLNAVGAVRMALKDVAASEPPQWIEPVDRQWLTGGWAEIERDPERFSRRGCAPANGSRLRCPCSAMPPKARRSKAMRSSTSTSEATTSASLNAGLSLSTGTRRASGIPSWT
jgi:hypothetical protein